MANHCQPTLTKLSLRSQAERQRKAEEEATRPAKRQRKRKKPAATVVAKVSAAAVCRLPFAVCRLPFAGAATATRPSHRRPPVTDARQIQQMPLHGGDEEVTE